MGSGAMISSALLAASAEIVAPPALNAVLPDDVGVNGSACDALIPAPPDVGVLPPEVAAGSGVSPLDPPPVPLSWPVIMARSVCATFTASAFLR